MRSLLLSVIALSAAVSSQLVLPLLDRNQVPLMDTTGPGPLMPPSGSSADSLPSGSGGDVMLSDVMGRDRSINLFAGYVVQPIS